ncbi:MAG: molecular chaperone DnaJ, partial [Ilumatobacteraceae bacterium]
MTAQRDWFEKDDYAILGVQKDAPAKDITKAYRKLARENHPDAKPGDAAAEERFKEISAAYDVLSDDEKRCEYDEVRRLGPMGGAGGGMGGMRFTVGGDTGSFEDLFRMFGGGKGRGGAGRGGVGPRRGSDLEAQLMLEFTEAALGATTTVHLTSDDRCGTCSGSGAHPGSSARTCPACSGRGQVDDNQGFFSFASPCTRCGGRGTVIDDPCKTCRGTGIERRNREVKVRVPAGVSNGQRIRLAGRGTPGTNGGPAGDLFIVCHVTAHTLFGRDGDNLTVKVPITFFEATLGADIDVPTLEGDRVTLRLKPGTQSGTRHRVTGRGIATTKTKGDVIVTVEVSVPTDLDDAQRTAVEAVARAIPADPRAHLFG